MPINPNDPFIVQAIAGLEFPAEAAASLVVLPGTHGLRTFVPSGRPGFFRFNHDVLDEFVARLEVLAARPPPPSGGPNPIGPLLAQVKHGRSLIRPTAAPAVPAASSPAMIHGVFARALPVQGGSGAPGGAWVGLAVLAGLVWVVMRRGG